MRIIMEMQMCKEYVQNVRCNYLIYRIVCNLYVFYINDEYMKTENDKYCANFMQKFLTIHTLLFINILSHTKAHVESAENRRGDGINTRGSPLLSSCLS